MAHKIDMYGVIGWDVLASDIVPRLDEIAASDDQDVRIHINSGGGLVDDALAIHNRLQSHPGRVSVTVDALAASAATLIALAADDVTMPDNATFMIHMPWNSAVGSASELRKAADRLDETAGSMVRMYAKRSGRDEEEIRAMLDEEVWMSAQEALDMGFADYVTSPVRTVDEQKTSAAAAYVGHAQATDLPKYQRPPEWVRRVLDTKPFSRRTTPSPENGMENKTQRPVADANEDELEKMKARLEELEEENASLKSALEANREEVDEAAAEKETMEARVRSLEDDLVRKDLTAAGIEASAHDNLVALKRADPKIYAMTVQTLKSKDGIQPPLGRVGDVDADGEVSVDAILAHAERDGIRRGTGQWPRWVAENYPEQYEKIVN